MRNKKGTGVKIIIFAIVFIICATVVSVSFTIFDFQGSKQNIEYTQKWLKYKYELAEYVSGKQAEDIGYNGALLNASYKSVAYGRNIDATINITHIIPSMSKSEMRNYMVTNGKLKYIGTDEKMKEVSRY